MIAFTLSGHTCGDACWHARELVCRCSCGGKNHGILLAGGSKPERTSKKDQRVYRLCAVAGDYHEAVATEREEMKAFPDAWLYQWPARLAPVIMRTASDAQANWPEVKAIEGNRKFLVWRLMAGQPYPRRDDSMGTAP